jgi:6-phosphogluconolactonase
MTPNHKFSGYIGTYTKGESKGIYAFTLDTAEEKIVDVKLAAELGNPTYLNISQDNKFLYAVVKDGENGGVAAFSIEESGELKEINRFLTPGSSPCHVSMDSENHYVFTANYHKGTVESHLIDQETGAVLPVVSVIQHEGSGPDPRQEKPHTHYAGLTPDERHLAVVELGTDALLTYRVHEDGTLEQVYLLPLKAGSGPRHLTFHPNGKFAYVMTEFSSEVIVLDFNKENKRFTEKQYISTLPENFKENNQGSAIHISSDGRFVYAGNRGHNSIAIFEVNWPRDFQFDPTEQFLIGSNQESGNLVLYKRDKEKGKLTLIQSDVKVPYPVCVKFLHV